MIIGRLDCTSSQLGTVRHHPARACARCAFCWTPLRAKLNSNMGMHCQEHSPAAPTAALNSRDRVTTTCVGGSCTCKSHIQCCCSRTIFKASMGDAHSVIDGFVMLCQCGCGDCSCNSGKDWKLVRPRECRVSTCNRLESPCRSWPLQSCARMIPHNSSTFATHVGCCARALQDLQRMEHTAARACDSLPNNAMKAPCTGSLARRTDSLHRGPKGSFTPELKPMIFALLLKSRKVGCQPWSDVL